MEERNIERRQLLSLGVLLFLAPALRLFPAEAAASAGRAAWLTPLAALPMLLSTRRFSQSSCPCGARERPCPSFWAALPVGPRSR